jgi:hypothetical protein
MPSCLSKAAVAWLLCATATAGAHTITGSSRSSLQAQSAYENPAAVVRHDSRRATSIEASEVFFTPLAAGNVPAAGNLAIDTAADGQSEQPSPGMVHRTVASYRDS